MHGVEWFEARGEVWRGWVWELADRRRRAKELLERLACDFVARQPMPPDTVFGNDPTMQRGHKVYR